MGRYQAHRTLLRVGGSGRRLSALQRLDLPRTRQQNAVLDPGASSRGTQRRRVMRATVLRRHTLTDVDWMQFVSALVDSAAWPLSAIACILLLRRHLVTLVPRLQRVKAFGGEAEFGPALDRVTASVERAHESDAAASALASSPDDESGVGDDGAEREPSAPPLEQSAAQELVERASLLAAVSPRASILDTWFSIEHALRRLPNVPSSARDMPLTRLIGSQRQLLTPEWLQAINDLRSLRNRVAHSDDVDVTAPVALDYAEAAARVIAHVNLVSRKVGSWDSFPTESEGTAALSALDALSEAAYNYFERLAHDAVHNDSKIEGCFFPAHDPATEELTRHGLAVATDAPFGEVPDRRYFRLTSLGRAAARVLTVQRTVPPYARDRLRETVGAGRVVRTRRGK